MPTIMHKGELIFRRINGYESPMDVFQRMAWLMFCYLVFSFYLLLIPIMEDLALQICSAIVHTILLAFMIFYWYVASATDPVDVTIFLKLQATPRHISSAELLYCQYCDCKVHKKSKHCRACNKCVGEFDHHCKWLNNCVGGANYKAFFRLIISAMLLTAVQAVFGVRLLLLVWMDEAWLGASPGAWWVANISRGAVIALLFTIAFFSVVASTLLLHLVGFHMWLQREGISTYDYILGKRAEKHVRKTDNKDEGTSSVLPPHTRSRHR
ncbi:DHHC palmitoyltransferase-domain-containing protein [Baffinella frigidus]|nr:DHHC palmitoyltransferase-domain-containing protein [Cryptophyta sp. CCMP2293]